MAFNEDEKKSFDSNGCITINEISLYGGECKYHKLDFDFDETSSISAIKQIYMNQTAIKLNNIIKVTYKKQELADHKMLKEYNYDFNGNDRITITLNIITISIKMLSGETLKLNVLPTNSMEDIMIMIKKFFFIDFNEYCLQFKGDNLETRWASVSYHKIQHGAIVKVVKIPTEGLEEISIYIAPKKCDNDPKNVNIVIHNKNDMNDYFNISSFHVSCRSDKLNFDKNMIGIVLYQYKKCTDWYLNGVHCKTGYILIKNSDKIQDIKTKQGTMHSKCYKFLFNQDPDNDVIGAGFAIFNGKIKYNSYTFNCDGGQGLISKYHDHQKSMHLIEQKCVEFALKNWKMNKIQTTLVKNMLKLQYLYKNMEDDTENDDDQKDNNNEEEKDELSNMFRDIQEFVKCPKHTYQCINVVTMYIKKVICLYNVVTAETSVTDLIKLLKQQRNLDLIHQVIIDKPESVLVYNGNTLNEDDVLPQHGIYDINHILIWELYDYKSMPSKYDINQRNWPFWTVPDIQYPKIRNKKKNKTIQIPSKFLCRISQIIMIDPVIYDEHVYDRQYLLQYVKE
eukprot:434631_1